MYVWIIFLFALRPSPFCLFIKRARNRLRVYAELNATRLAFLVPRQTDEREFGLTRKLARSSASRETFDVVMSRPGKVRGDL